MEMNMTTKNGDMPAMPITSEQAVDADMWGMSKREMMAMHVLSGLIASGYGATHEGAARSAVMYTDAILAELERTK